MVNIKTGKQDHVKKASQHIERMLANQPEYVRGYYYHIKLDSKTESYGTHVQYINKVIRFLNYVNKPIEDIKMSDVERFMVDVSIKKNGEPVSGSYSVVIYSALKKFFDYLVGDEYISKSPMEKIGRPAPKKANQVERTFLTKSEVRKCFKAIDEGNANSIYKVRDKAILTILFATGIRNTCLTEINVDNVDQENNCIYVIDKEDKAFTVWLNEENMEIIREWIKIRDMIMEEHPEEKALFISRLGKRMGQGATADVVKKASKAIGHEITPHKARGTYCTLAYNDGIPLDIVSKLMHHSSTKITVDCYLQGQEEKIREAGIKAARIVKL